MSWHGNHRCENFGLLVFFHFLAWGFVVVDGFRGGGEKEDKGMDSSRQ